MRAFVRVVVSPGCVLLAAFRSTAFAEDAYPSKPVHIFVPYPPGGAVDIVTRTLGDELAKRWNQSVVVENRPGAGSIVAEEALVQAPPDGYTLIVVASGHALSGAFLRQAALRHVQGFHADRADRLGAEHAPGAVGFAVQIGRRFARGSARQAAANCPTATPATARRPISPANCSNIWRRSRSRRCRTKAACRR